MNDKQTMLDTLLSEPDFDDEGFIDYNYGGESYKLWYGRIGSSRKDPALVLHGGPGGNHHNLVAFQALADERPVIFYDQLGCGKSDRPDDKSLWIAERYFDEVRVLRDGLGLKKYHLIGHSWGTTLAVGFNARHPEGVLSVSLHSPVLHFPHYINHVAPKLKQELSCLDGKAGQIIDDYELRAVGKKCDYDEACMEFTKRHITHSWPLPVAMQKLIAARNSDVHDTMIASGSELNIPGNLKSVDLTTQLSKVDVPLLMTCGSDDLCTLAYTKWQSDFATVPQVHVIPQSAHMTLVDNPLELLRLQREFLEESETI